MKNFLGEALKNKPLDTVKVGAAKNVDNDDFPMVDGAIMMIFGGTPARPPRRKHMRILQEIYHAKPIVPLYLRWSMTMTTPPKIIPYYHLNHSIWSSSDNKELSR
jgi:hypothetical protein